MTTITSSSHSPIIHDLTLPITPSLIVWPGDPPVRITQEADVNAGDDFNLSRLEMSAHTGTHVDAPAHFISGGGGVETLPLDVLIGPALVVELLDVTEITAVTLSTLSIPPHTQRLLLKTRNSDRWADEETQFHEDFVAITAGGAQWLVDHGIRLVGVDYLSVAPYEATTETHVILLQAGIIPLEGLNLRGISPGEYQFICLPLLLPGCDGAPCRAVLLEIGD
ncbi:MAG TPA: cyclase family protein [Anaerolineae bacterium]|nr:cyclase family protein [Anaerolineae bacterium]